MMRTFWRPTDPSLWGKFPSSLLGVCGTAALIVVLANQCVAETVTLAPTADASVYRGRSDWNYGGQTYCVVGTGGWHTVMKFNLTGLDAAASDGELKLTFYYDTGFDGYDIAVSEMPLSNTDWVEGSTSGSAATGVTWDYKSGTSASPTAWVGDSHDYSVTDLEASSVFGTGETTMTITIDQDDLNTWIARGGEVSLLLTSPEAEKAGVTGIHLTRIYTNEHATESPAQLSFATVPEPSSLLMLAAAVLGLAICARRGRKNA